MEKKATSSGSNEFSLGKGPSFLGERHLPQGDELSLEKNSSSWKKICFD